jgi:hypothetical protein
MIQYVVVYAQKARHTVKRMSMTSIKFPVISGMPTFCGSSLEDALAGGGVRWLSAQRVLTVKDPNDPLQSSDTTCERITLLPAFTAPCLSFSHFFVTYSGQR